jgi:signal transduction histidine kinase
VVLGYNGPLAEEDVKGFRARVEQMPLYSRVLATRAPVILPDILGDTPDAVDFQTTAAVQVKQTLGPSRSLMGIPIILKGEVIGLLRLDHVQPNHFTTHDAQLALAIANVAASAMENARLYGQVQETAALKERQHLARELHDSVSQALYGIALGTHAARLMVEREPARIPETLSYVLRLAETAVAEMRALIFELRPEALAEEGLTAALTKQAAALQAQHGIAIETDLREEPLLPLKNKEALYRIAQEALHNTFKHAHASKVVLRLYTRDGCVVLDVCDDGVGFDPGVSFPGHLGLKSMKERTERLGGDLTIDSAPGKGVRLSVTVPV